MQRVLITGANGFIGSVLAQKLWREHEAHIVAVDPVPLKNRPGLLDAIPLVGYWSDQQLLNFISSHQLENFDIVYHLGACSDTTETDAQFLKKNNVEFSQRLASWCEAKSIPFIYASSAAVYGSGASGYSDQAEFNKLKPLNLYGESKLQFDSWLAQQNFKTRWHGLRFFNVFGPNENYKGHMSSLVYKAFFQIMETGKLKLFKSYKKEYSDGGQLRDFVYVKDIVRWLIELGQTNDIPSGVYNQGFGTARTWLDLAKACFQALGRPEQIEFIEMPESIRNQYQYFTQADMTQWLKMHGSQPQWPLESAIANYIEAHLLKSGKFY